MLLDMPVGAGVVMTQIRHDEDEDRIDPDRVGTNADATGRRREQADHDRVTMRRRWWR
jgi:hypothetical protein